MVCAPVVLGVIIGVLGTVGVATYLESVVAQLGGADALVVVVVAALVLGAGAGASLLPAARVARVRPMRVLGSD